MNDFAQYGVLGAVVVALAAYVLMTEARHRKERDEWRITMKDQFEKTLQSDKETNTVLRENTNILAGLKTLLEIRK